MLGSGLAAAALGGRSTQLGAGTVEAMESAEMHVTAVSDRLRRLALWLGGAAGWRPRGACLVGCCVVSTPKRQTDQELPMGTIAVFCHPCKAGHNVPAGDCEQRAHVSHRKGRRVVLGHLSTP